jgi:cytosine/creatinine deaminase
VLPATDLFLMGRDRELHVPRGVAPVHRLLDQGVTCALATNNVLNPFTPFGDCSLIRMANLYPISRSSAVPAICKRVLR